MPAYPSLTLVFLLTAAAALGTLAVVDSCSATTEGLQKACNATSSPRICLKVLTRASPAESPPASPRRLAELAFRYLERKAPALLAEARRETAATRNQSMLYCLREFNDNIRIYVGWLHGLAPARGDAEFVEVKRRLEALLDAPSSSGISCRGSQFDEKPVIRRIFAYEAMMQVTLDLMNAAARSNPALADPPSDYYNGIAGMPEQ